MENELKKGIKNEKLKKDLYAANKELLYQNEEKEKRAAELLVANKELLYQNEEKEKRAAELLVANKELLYQNEEKEKRAAELLIANKELLFQNEEKEKRAAELSILKDSLFNEKQLLEKTLISIGDAVISLDKNKNIMFLNKIAESVTGWTQKEVIGKPIYSVFNIINELTRKKTGDIVEEVIISGKIQQLPNHTILCTKDGKEVLIEDSAAPIFDEKGIVTGVVIVFRDYTEKWKQIQKIEHIGLHDELTGLYNRRFYEEEIKRIDTRRNLPLSLVMGDVNGLKLINDSFGHQTGDELLKKVAEAIKQGCRADDVSARIGGDEFVILLPHSNALETEVIVKRIRNILSNEKVAGIKVSISFGSGTKTNMKQDIQDLFKITENNMYKHKLYESTSMRSETIDLIARTLYEKNGRELIHSRRVSEICEAISKKMGLDKDSVNSIRLAGLMHDIGKIGIADYILNKPGKLSDEEYIEIKRHPEIGYRILSSVNDFSEISQFVLEHQEKWDGSGYPQGLKGEGIKIEARIIGIADAYAAMTNQRSYGDILNEEEALKEIRRCSGTQFDPKLVKFFLEQVVPVWNVVEKTEDV